MVTFADAKRAYDAAFYAAHADYFERRKLESRCSREVYLPDMGVRYRDTPNGDGTITREILALAPTLSWVDVDLKNGTDS